MILLVVELILRFSTQKKHKGMTVERNTTNGVNRCHLDDLAERKCVEIHRDHWGNKLMGFWT